MGHPNIRMTNAASEMRRFGAQAVLDVSNAVVQFAAADISDDCKYVLIQVQAQPVRITYDDSDPTAAVGQRKVAGDEGIFLRETLLAMKFIREGATDAKVWAQPCDLA
jgi:hypothetical protein